MLTSLTTEERCLVHSEDQNMHLRLNPFNQKEPIGRSSICPSRYIFYFSGPRKQKSILASGWRFIGSYKETEVEMLPPSLPPRRGL